jgi:hypothetical protein
LQIPSLLQTVLAVAAAISASTFTTAIAQTPPVPVTDSQE